MRSGHTKEGQHSRINKKLLKIYKILKKIEVKFYSLLFKNYLSSGYPAEVKYKSLKLKGRAQQSQRSERITLFSTESSAQPKQQGFDVDKVVLFNSNTENKGQRAEPALKKK